MSSLMTKCLWAVLSIECIELLYFIYSSFQKRSCGILNEAIFFTDKGVQCCKRGKKCLNKECSFTYLRRVVEHIESTSESLDVCIYQISCFDIANAIINILNQGKKVRIIIDGNTALEPGSHFELFMKNGVPIRMKKSEYLMHNKFFVIDKRLLLTGSCNWTMQAIMGNWENVIITSEPMLVKPFADHFSELWDEFSAL